MSNVKLQQTLQIGLSGVFAAYIILRGTILT